MNVLLMVNLKKSQSRNTLQNYSYFIQAIRTLGDFRLNKTSHGSLSSGHQDLFSSYSKTTRSPRIQEITFLRG